MPPPDKREARRKFSLPEEGNIALALGFLTATKGLDIIRKMKVPAGWKIVVNTSRNHYNMEKIKEKFDNEGVIELGKGFLADKELSLLLYCADALILPYKVSSGSGVMYDGLAHGLPFVSSNIEFFKEFSNLGLGISVERDPVEFLGEYYHNIYKIIKNRYY
jgi:glycosyltransferase involved in cell wall biosynthesis